MEKMKIDGISFGRVYTPERHRKKLYSACEIIEKIDKSKDGSGRKTGKDNHQISTPAIKRVKDSTAIVMVLSMDQSNTIPKPHIKSTICEASDCSADATTQINVPVGNLGTINLFLCENCKSKFSVQKLR